MTDANGTPEWRHRAALLIFVLAAGLGIIWTISNVREALSPPPPPPGGIGALSIGVSEAVVETVLILPGLILINWLLGRAARYDSLAKRFRRTHFWLTLTYMVWGVVSTVLVVRDYAGGAETFYKTMKVVNVVSAPSPPLQLFFAGSAVAFFVRGKRRSGRAALISQTEE